MEGIPMGEKQKLSGSEALKEIDRLLRPLARSNPQAAKIAAKILDLIPVVDAALRKITPRPRREQIVKSYRVEDAREGDRLAEYRGDNDIPLACPHQVYL